MISYKDLSYPPIQVNEKNPVYANLLSMDYCGAVSEMSAITRSIEREANPQTPLS